MESLTNGVINVHVNPAVPFEVAEPIYSNELEDALKETIIIENEYKAGTRSSIKMLMKC